MQSFYRRLFVRTALLLMLPLIWGSMQRSAASDVPPPEGLTAMQEAQLIPEFTASMVTGATMHSSALHGKVTVLRFWASW